MSKTVPLTYEELGMVIEYFLNKKHKNGLMWAALACLMYLTGCRISEALAPRINQIADDKLKLYPVIQLIKLKTEQQGKKTIVLPAGAPEEKTIKEWLLKSKKITAESDIIIKVEIVKQKKETATKRAIDIDTGSRLVKIIEEWLVMARHRYTRINSDYVFSVRMAGSPVKYTSAYKAFVRAYHKLGIDYVSHGTHGIRKTAGQSQYEIAFDQTKDGFRAMQIVQGFYDHQSAKTTEKYLPPPEKTKKEIAAQHSARLKIGNSLS